MEAQAVQPEAPPPSGDLVIPKSRVWPVFVFFGAVVLVVSGLAYRAFHAPEPLRVLIAVDLEGTWWEGSEPAADLADKLSSRLAKLGFDPVKAGDPEVTRVLEKAKSPEEAAAALRAAFVITGHLTPQLTEHPVEGGFFELRVDAPIVTRNLADAKGEEGRVRGFAGAKEKARATRLLASSIADQTFDAVLPVMTRHPSIVELFEGRADPKLAGLVAPARDYVALRNKALERAASAYKDLEARHAALEKGPAKVTYHGSGASADMLCATGRDGYLVKTNDIRPFYSPDQGHLGWIENLETLEWRKPDGGTRPLWAGYHVFSYPSAAPAGVPAVLVEDLFGWAKTITLVQADGQSHRVRVDPQHRFVDPKVAPGGGAVAFYDRPCQSCPSSISVLDVGDGRELFRVPDGAGVFGGFAFLDATRLVYTLTTPPRDLDGLYVVDVRKASSFPELVVEAEVGESFAFPSASGDGKQVAVQLRGSTKGQLGVLAVEEKKLRRFEAGGTTYNPTFSPEGTELAFIVGRPSAASNEVAVLALASAEVRVLTQNPFDERYPLFSSDGARVYFESIDEDPNFPNRRTVHLIASVPARP